MLIANLEKLLNGSTDDLIDLNDWAVNTVREYASAKGYDALTLVTEEKARIDAGDLDLGAYLGVSRIGSRFCLSRVTRKAVFAIVATRRALAPSRGGAA